jgi:hypothetical protein
MPHFRIRRRFIRFVLPMLTAAALLLVLVTLTSWAANTVVWQPASTGLPASGVIRDVAFGDVTTTANLTWLPEQMAWWSIRATAPVSGTVLASAPACRSLVNMAMSSSAISTTMASLISPPRRTALAPSGRGQATGRATDAWSKHPGTYEGLAFADVNHDGWQDLIVAGGAPVFPGILVFQNNFASFSQTTSITTSGTYYDLAAGYSTAIWLMSRQLRRRARAGSNSGVATLARGPLRIAA